MSIAEIINKRHNPVITEPLGEVGKAKRIAVSATSQAVTLEATTQRISLEAVAGPVRFVIGEAGETVTASASNAGGISHYIGAGQIKDFRVAPGSQIAAIRADGTTTATALEITELV